MTLTWIDQTTIGVGLALAALYLLRCWQTKSKPALAMIVTCVASGGALFFGAMLIAVPFFPDLQKVAVQPVHYVIAGVALMWVGVDFIISLWKRTTVLDASPPHPLTGTANTLPSPRPPAPVPIIGNTPTSVASAVEAEDLKEGRREN